MLHRVRIELVPGAAPLQYSLFSGEEWLPWVTVRDLSEGPLRVAVVANWHARPPLPGILKDDPQVLMTAGDNIPDLYSRCGDGVRDCVIPYVELIGTYPELFARRVFMPVLGNHDKQIRPRGNRPPSEAVYDVEATAFRLAFDLPEPEWWWRWVLPGHGVTFLALDLHHLRDMGTTWQTCHPWDEDSDQFRWYKSQLDRIQTPFVLTLYNAKHSEVRGLAGGLWRPWLARNDCLISGFGHFGEIASWENVLLVNTSLRGTGDRYPDPNSEVLLSRDNYVLLEFAKDEEGRTTLAVRLKGLDGTVLAERLLVSSTTAP